jgi:uncharacterized protein YdhG (YjbR/CyaY superfamily)
MGNHIIIHETKERKEHFAIRRLIMKENIDKQTIDDYIEMCSVEIQPKLHELRKIILEVAPELKEKISWKMPTFYLKENIIHFAAHKKHIGLYPGVEAIVNFAERLEDYKTSKGAIQIPNDKALDIELIQDIVKFNIQKTK